MQSQIPGNRTDTARSLIAAIRESGIERVADLLADDVVMEAPYAPDGVPRRIQGKAEVMQALGFVSKVFSRFRLNAHECHESPSRNTVILECTGFGLLHGEAPAYQNRYVFVLGFRDGLIYRWREFFNPYPVLWLGLSEQAKSHKNP